MYCQTNANLPFMRRRSITGVDDTAVENYILMIDGPLEIVQIDIWIFARRTDRHHWARNSTAPRAEISGLKDGFVERSKRVSRTCLISFARNRCSVPASFANRIVSLRVYPERLVLAAEGQILCEHPRRIDRSNNLPPRTTYDWRHYLAVIQRKPGALRNGAPFAEMPAAFRQHQDLMLPNPGGGREMVDILALVLHHDEQAVLTAVEKA